MGIPTPNLFQEKRSIFQQGRHPDGDYLPIQGTELSEKKVLFLGNTLFDDDVAVDAGFSADDDGK